MRLSHSNTWTKENSHGKGTFHSQKGTFAPPEFLWLFPNLETLSCLATFGKLGFDFPAGFPNRSTSIPPTNFTPCSFLGDSPALPPDAQNLGCSRLEHLELCRNITKYRVPRDGNCTNHSGFGKMRTSPTTLVKLPAVREEKL